MSIGEIYGWIRPLSNHQKTLQIAIRAHFNIKTVFKVWRYGDSRINDKTVAQPSDFKMDIPLHIVTAQC